VRAGLGRETETVVLSDASTRALSSLVPLGGSQLLLHVKRVDPLGDLSSDRREARRHSESRIALDRERLRNPELTPMSLTKPVG
jgi:hypothetical protein